MSGNKACQLAPLTARYAILRSVYSAVYITVYSTLYSVVFSRRYAYGVSMHS